MKVKHPRSFWRKFKLSIAAPLIFSLTMVGLMPINGFIGISQAAETNYSSVKNDNYVSVDFNAPKVIDSNTIYKIKIDAKSDKNVKFGWAQINLPENQSIISSTYPCDDFYSYNICNNKGDENNFSLELLVDAGSFEDSQIEFPVDVQYEFGGVAKLIKERLKFDVRNVEYGEIISFTGKNNKAVNVNQNIEYNYKISGSAPADEVVFSFFVPEGTKYETVDGRGCEYAVEDRQVRCTYKNTGASTFGQPDIIIKADEANKLSKLTAYAQLSYKIGSQRYVTSSQKLESELINDNLECKPVNDPSLFPQKNKITLDSLKSSEAEKERLQTESKIADFQPTGFCIQANKEFTVETFNDFSDQDSGEKAQALIGTPGLVDPYSKDDNSKFTRIQSKPRIYDLSEGINKIKDPQGGLVYIRYLTNEANIAEHFVISGTETGVLNPIPRFNYGKTSNSQWQKMLSSSNGGFAEIAGFEDYYGNVVITASQDSMKRFSGEDQNQLLDTYKNIIKSQDEVNSQNEENYSNKERTGLIYYISEGVSGANPNAGDYRVSWPSSDQAEMLSAEGVRSSWGMFHELGHMHQLSWSWGDEFESNDIGEPDVGETSVNIYSLAAQKIYPNTTNSWGTLDTWNESKKYFEDSSRIFGKASHKSKLLMFAQLEATFGEKFYPKLNAILLERKPKFKNDQERIDFFAVSASEASEKDLTKYFVDDWRMPISESAIKSISELKLSPSKIDVRELNPYSRDSLKRDIFIRYKNNTRGTLKFSDILVPNGEVIVAPRSVNPGETGVFRVGVKEDKDLTGKIIFQREKEQGATVQFDWNIPVYFSNSYSVESSASLKVITTDYDGNTRESPPGQKDSFTSQILGQGDLPVLIWLDISDTQK